MNDKIKQMIGEWWYRSKRVTPEGIYELVMEIFKLYGKSEKDEESKG